MKKNLWPALLAVLVLVIVGAWGRGQAVERQTLENHLLAQYQRSFYDLATSVQDIEVLLSKTLVANGNMDTELLSKISLEAQAAQSNVTNLPVQDVVAARTSKFLAQVGDYAAVMSLRKEGSRITNEDRETLQKLYRQARDLNEQIHTIENKISDGSIHLVEMIRESRSGLRQEQNSSSAAGNFDNVDKIMQEYPSLIYDGPFSDHLENRQPVDLPGEEIKPEQARTKALDFIEKEPNAKYRSKLINNIKSRIPAYEVEITKDGDNENSPGAIVAISKKGGHPVWMIMPHIPDGNGGEKWTLQSTRDKAEKFLADRGFKNMEPVGHQLSGGLVTHVFVPLQENILVYSEPVKVTIAQDNGQITGFEATEYLMMNHDRKLPKPKISLNEARGKLCPGSKVEEERLVIITTDTLEELLAYEFRVSRGDEVFLIYINAENGKEEKILRVIQGPEGIFTI